MLIQMHLTASITVNPNQKYKYIYSGTPLVSPPPSLFAPEMWPFKRVGLSSGVEINAFIVRFTMSSGLPRGVGLSSGWPL